MSLRRLFLFTATALTVFTTGCMEQPPAEQSCNFVQNQYGRRVSWARLPVKFYADASITDAQLEGITRAMAVWNAYFDRPVFELIGRVFEDQFSNPPEINAQGRVVPDGFNVIYLTDSQLFTNSGTRDEQARTSISFRGDFIYEADILIDESEDFYFFEQKDLARAQSQVSFESLMVHELGHVLGLEHIDDVENSVMDPKLQQGEFRTELGEADLESLACEY